MINRLARTRMHAGSFKALGHPIRMAIVEHLAGGPLNVCALQYLLGTNLSNISRHLVILRDARLVVEGRCGAEMCYRLRTSIVSEFQKRLDDVLGVPQSSAQTRVGRRDAMNDCRSKGRS